MMDESESSIRSTDAQVVHQPESNEAASRLFEMVLGATSEAGDTTGDTSTLTSILQQPSLESAILYVQRRLGKAAPSADDLIDTISQDIAEIDRMITRQVNAILHHDKFQALESAWRGIEILVNSASGGESRVRIGLLHVRKDELFDDLRDALEFDQSEIFQKVYEEEYGMAGGEPFGALIGNYEFKHTPADVELLSRISGIAAAAFAPFIGAAHPQMFGMEGFEKLERLSGDLSSLFSGPRFIKWQSLRESEDARYVGLALPRVLMREPYDLNPMHDSGFVFKEDVSGPTNTDFLWGNAAFAFGAVLIRAFQETGWLADIRGTMHGRGTGGMVHEIPTPSFRTDSKGIALKCSVETKLGDEREKELSDLGFLPLSDCPDSAFSNFSSTQSLQKARVFDDEEATANSKLGSMLQYILCSSRFAHYIKVMAREKIGSNNQPAEIQQQLHDWLHQFVSADPGADPRIRAKYPLRSASVELRKHPLEPGHYIASVTLAPHYQLDEMTGSVKLVQQLHQ